MSVMHTPFVPWAVIFPLTLLMTPKGKKNRSGSFQAV